MLAGILVWWCRIGLKFALAMAPKERTFSIRTAMLILTVGGGLVAIAAALVVGWLSYREYRDRIGSSLIATSRVSQSRSAVSRATILRKRLRHDYKHSLAPIAPWLGQIGVELTLISLSALNWRFSRNARASAA
jgi:hypothetical protein